MYYSGQVVNYQNGNLTRAGNCQNNFDMGYVPFSASKFSEENKATTAISINPHVVLNLFHNDFSNTKSIEVITSHCYISV